MKVCDICGGKDKVETSKYPQAKEGRTYFQYQSGVRGFMWGDYHEDTNIDVCEQCRKEIYEYIESMKERLK